ncbi:hypothetical protein HK105_203748 [Polyrhizophydium stewartii]|uniref:Basal body-orientation factor 1 n=1 Tax=Polyrhizophydium stewartii TaxID=2732419 RepID=A0ABR4NB05_9FUNG
MSTAPSEPAVAASADEDALASTTSKKTAKGGKKKGKKGKRAKAVKLPKDMVTNDRGEVVTTREYALEKTLEATSKSLRQTQERMENLVQTNEMLNETRQQQEKDALEVIAALHQECEAKDREIKELKEKMMEQEVLSKKAREAVVEESDRKIAEFNAILNEKEAAYKIMQQEFSVIKDFRRKRQDLMRDLEQQKHELSDTEKRHKDIITRLERKFFEEKIRLQKEANRKISELATKAHKEAVLNLKDTTKEVYKENIRMAEALRYHVQEGEELAKMNAELVEANRQLTEEKDLHNVVVKEKIMQTKKQEQEIKELKFKISSMEHSLSHVVREFEHERDIIGNLARRELDEVRQVADRLRSSLARKTLEMKHIKRLAQHILDQRTELEQFFLDSLEMVKSEIRKLREKAAKESQVEYNQRMRTVFKEKGVVPPVQSFRPPPARLRGEALAEALINGDGEIKPIGANPGAKLDIKDLSWEDKERVLRILFAKMNGMSLAKAAEAAERSRAQLNGYRGSLGSNGFARGFDREVDIDHTDFDDAPPFAPQAEQNSSAGALANSRTNGSNLALSQSNRSGAGGGGGDGGQISGTNDSGGQPLAAGAKQPSMPAIAVEDAQDELTQSASGAAEHPDGATKLAGLPSLPMFALNDVEGDLQSSMNGRIKVATGMPEIKIEPDQN